MTTNLNIRTDKEVKEKSERLFDELGLNMTTAVNMFLRQAIRVNGIPFEVKADTPNAETLAALDELKEARKQKDKKTYDSFSELLAEVSADV